MLQRQQDVSSSREGVSIDQLSSDDRIALEKIRRALEDRGCSAFSTHVPRLSRDGRVMIVKTCHSMGFNNVRFEEQGKDTLCSAMRRASPPAVRQRPHRPTWPN